MLRGSSPRAVEDAAEMLLARILSSDSPFLNGARFKSLAHCELPPVISMLTSTVSGRFSAFTQRMAQLLVERNPELNVLPSDTVSREPEMTIRVHCRIRASGTPSFKAQQDGWVSDELIEMVMAELQDVAQKDRPTIYDDFCQDSTQWFDEMDELARQLASCTPNQVLQNKLLALGHQFVERGAEESLDDEGGLRL